MDDLIGTTPVEQSPQEVPQIPPNEAPPEEEGNLETQDDADPSPEADFAEVDFSGKKYKLPKELIPIIEKAENLEAGVTKRFQEAADTRKQAEALIQSVQREQEINQHLVKEISQLTAVEERLNQFSQVDWQGWQAQNPQAANAAMAELLQLQQAHGQLRGNVENRRAEIGASQNERAQTLISQAVEALNKPDPAMGWAGKFDETTRAELTKFANTELKIPLERLQRVIDPLEIKMLNMTRLAFEMLKKQRSPAPAPTNSAQPVPQVTNAKSTSQKLPDKMSYKEFKAYREKGGKL